MKERIIRERRKSFIISYMAIIVVFIVFFIAAIISQEVMIKKHAIDRERAFTNTFLRKIVRNDVLKDTELIEFLGHCEFFNAYKIIMYKNGHEVGRFIKQHPIITTPVISDLVVSGPYKIYYEKKASLDFYQLSSSRRRLIIFTIWFLGLTAFVLLLVKTINDKEKKFQRELTEIRLRDEKLKLFNNILLAVNHYFGNSLTVIKGYSELFRDKELSSAQIKEICDIIHGEVNTLEETLKKMRYLVDQGDIENINEEWYKFIEELRFK